MSATAPGAGAAAPSPAAGTRAGSRVLAWALIVAVALAVTVCLRLFVVQTFTIPTGSMAPTLRVGDHVLIDKASYLFRDPRREEVVVFDGAGSWDPAALPPRGVAATVQHVARRLLALPEPGTEDYVKRVIGVPGDHVVCCDAGGRLVVNGHALTETYLSATDPTPFDIVVPPGRLWVMGDNRPNSADSRAHRYDPGGGTIPISAVLGRAVLVVWPSDRWGPVR